MEKSYDAFITYRGGPDATTANALYEIIKRHGLVPAIDSIDFSPEETFFDEMARCVAQSRCTIALISSRYASSHFPKEEAIMQQILDNKEKQRRLLVVYIEDVPAPLWLQSRVGIRLYLDTEDNKSELKKLLKHLLVKEKNLTTKELEGVERIIDVNLRNLPKQLLKIGTVGFAGYGVLSALANASTANDVADTVASEAASSAVADHIDIASDHVRDNSHGLLAGLGKVAKNLLDDLF